MIKSIYVKHFQSLREVGLVLGRLTVVVGSTNVGKSALMRAVKAMVENRRGESFMFDGAVDCQVSIDVGTDIVTWYKPLKKSALFYVGGGSGRPMRQVPPEMAIDVLRLRRVELSKTVSLLLNFQNQLDAPFLLAESDVVKSKVLGEITNAGLILISINLLKRWATTNVANMSVRQYDVSNTQYALARYARMEDLGHRLHVLQALMLTLGKQVAERSRLNELFISARFLTLRLNSLVAVTDRLHALDDRLKQTRFGSGVMESDEIALLTILARSEGRIEAEVAVAKVVNRKRQIISDHLPNLTTVEQLMSQLTTLAGYNDAFEQNQVTTKMLEQQVTTAEQQLRLADDNVDKIRAELKVCPLCEAPLVAEEHTHAEA